MLHSSTYPNTKESRDGSQCQRVAKKQEDNSKANLEQKNTKPASKILLPSALESQTVTRKMSESLKVISVWETTVNLTLVDFQT